MTRPPLILGLTLCEDVVVDDATQSISVIRAFTGLGFEGFPDVAAPFCAFATLTAGLGEAIFRLEMHHDEVAPLEHAPVYRLRGRLHFQDPLQTVYLVVRLSQCPFPMAGEYLFTLWIDDAWMAQRCLRVHGQ